MATEQRLGNNLLDSGTDLFYKGIAIPLVVNLGGVRFVSKNGNDATGAIGRQDRPYLTIQAAITASANGDAVYVYPGSYVEKLNVTPKTNLTLILQDALISYAGADTNPGLYISTTKLNIFAYGTSSLTRTNQTSGFAVECAGNATFNFANFTITGNQGGLANGVLNGGELFRCKITAQNGTALNAIYNGITCFNCEFNSEGTGTGLICQLPAGQINRFENCRMKLNNTYSIRLNSDGFNLFNNCQIVNTINKPLRVEAGTNARFTGCKLKGTVYSEIIQSAYSLSFNDCEFISITTQPVYFYNSPTSDYICEFLRCKFIAAVNANYSLDNAFPANNKINALNCLANKPFNNIAGVLVNNTVDANLKELV